MANFDGRDLAAQLNDNGTLPDGKSIVDLSSMLHAINRDVIIREHIHLSQISPSKFVYLYDSGALYSAHRPAVMVFDEIQKQIDSSNRGWLKERRLSDIVCSVHESLPDRLGRQHGGNRQGELATVIAAFAVDLLHTAGLKGFGEIGMQNNYGIAVPDSDSMELDKRRITKFYEALRLLDTISHVTYGKTPDLFQDQITHLQGGHIQYLVQNQIAAQSGVPIGVTGAGVEIYAHINEFKPEPTKPMEVIHRRLGAAAATVYTFVRKPRPGQ